MLIAHCAHDVPAQQLSMLSLFVKQEALPDIVDALDNHPDEVDIQTKGLVLLGVLIQVRVAAAAAAAAAAA